MLGTAAVLTAHQILGNEISQTDLSPLGQSVFDLRRTH